MGGRRRVSAKPLTKAAEDLAVNITYHRHQADMTRKDFAKKLGISVQYLWELSVCMANPTLEIIESIADCYSACNERRLTLSPIAVTKDHDRLNRLLLCRPGPVGEAHQTVHFLVGEAIVCADGTDPFHDPIFTLGGLRGGVQHEHASCEEPKHRGPRP
jgi:transcriptional regulator with XRE-family HTH domain